jgi:hypothetical protein
MCKRLNTASITQMRDFDMPTYWLYNGRWPLSTMLRCVLSTPDCLENDAATARSACRMRFEQGSDCPLSQRQTPSTRS